MADWFAEWFDSPYYHLLYQHRNDEEAAVFIENLFNHLNLQKDDKVLDLACGKGRHSRFLNSKGLRVTGVDLSPQSIKAASQFASDNLTFVVGDMREPVAKNEFQAVFNLFTSFGYFDDLGDNKKVLEAVNVSLLEDGILVIDFLNAEKLQQTIVPQETIHRDDITFEIQRKIENGKVFKQIKFQADNHDYCFTEQVQLIDQDTFSKLLDETGFILKGVYGDYNLGKFAPLQSDRLILIAQKK